MMSWMRHRITRPRSSLIFSCLMKKSTVLSTLTGYWSLSRRHTRIVFRVQPSLVCLSCFCVHDQMSFLSCMMRANHSSSTSWLMWGQESGSSLRTRGHKMFDIISASAWCTCDLRCVVVWLRGCARRSQDTASRTPSSESMVSCTRRMPLHRRRICARIKSWFVLDPAESLRGATRSPRCLRKGLPTIVKDTRDSAPIASVTVVSKQCRIPGIDSLGNFSSAANSQWKQTCCTSSQNCLCCGSRGGRLPEPPLAGPAVDAPAASLPSTTAGAEGLTSSDSSIMAGGRNRSSSTARLMAASLGLLVFMASSKLCRQDARVCIMAVWWY
mmetsp:Transcript_27437/g.70675  ORF Transcript_27437/g.70675 Transcript_27437/m.70675 type:complete len:327 (+) Transcript_27437:298-1278(+)